MSGAGELLDRTDSAPGDIGRATVIEELAGAMTQTAIATTRLFQTRDLFVHDGNHLRRLRLSAPAQLVMLVVMVLLFAWSTYSAIRLFIAPSIPTAAAPAA